jgi:hypothetical protein
VGPLKAHDPRSHSVLAAIILVDREETNSALGRSDRAQCCWKLFEA